MRSSPAYLVIGHVSKDTLPEGNAPGGSVLYASITAQRLGLQAAIVTACALEDDALLDAARGVGVWVHRVDSPASTTFSNIYNENGDRTQVISAHAATLSYDDIPIAWSDAPIVHLAPVARELPVLDTGMFSRCLLGVTPQGWMRSWDAQGNVLRSAWPVPPALANLPLNAFLVLSLEDLGSNKELLPAYAELASLVAVTQGADEAWLYDRDSSIAVPSCHADPVDPTGAGDVFAAALFVRYNETGDLLEAARFAHAAAACSIEGQGPSAIPERARVEQRMG
jgi:sugar/nucleoside kinase (ribokinase family)